MMDMKIKMDNVTLKKFSPYEDERSEIYRFFNNCSVNTCDMLEIHPNSLDNDFIYINGVEQHNKDGTSILTIDGTDKVIGSFYDDKLIKYNDKYIDAREAAHKMAGVVIFCEKLSWKPHHTTKNDDNDVTYDYVNITCIA